MIKKIAFTNYKAFKEREEIDLRHVTLILGKNSSGKTSILKLFPMFANMLSGDIQQPLLLVNEGLSLGSDYRDLFHNMTSSDLVFELVFTDDCVIKAEYAVNGDDIFMTRYQFRYGDFEIEKGLNDDKTGIWGLCYLEYFSKIKPLYNILNSPIEYLAPIRSQAPRAIVFKGFDNTQKVGYDGRGAYDILLSSYRKDGGLFKRVSEWSDKHLEGQSLMMSNSANNSGIFSLMVKRKGVDVNIAGVGQGMSQVLPVLVQAYYAKENSINIIEQPALHLHPAAHSELSYLFGTMSKERKCKFIIESHSENVLLGFRKMIVDKNCNFTPDDISIYYVDECEEGSYLQRIHIDERGDLSYWPTGVFSESFEILREINRMAR